MLFLTTEAVSDVLIYLYPKYSDQIMRLETEQINKLPSHNNNDLLLKKGLTIGDKVSSSVINYTKSDISEISWIDNRKNVLATRSCIWNGSNPINPMAGYWKTYILKSGSEIRAKAP